MQVKEIAVRDEPMDLGSLAACSPKLKTLVVSEFWGVGPVQPHNHILQLPNCTTLSVRNSINVLSLNIWAPAVKQLWVLGLRLKEIKLGPGGPGHLAHHAVDKLRGRYPAAKVTLLRDVLDEKAIFNLERHSQVAEVGYDDEAMEAMKLILDSVKKELSILRATNEDSISCLQSPRRRSPRRGNSPLRAQRPFSATS